MCAETSTMLKVLHICMLAAETHLTTMPFTGSLSNNPATLRPGKPTSLVSAAPCLPTTYAGVSSCASDKAFTASHDFLKRRRPTFLSHFSSWGHKPLSPTRARWPSMTCRMFCLAQYTLPSHAQARAGTPAYVYIPATSIPTRSPSELGCRVTTVVRTLADLVAGHRQEELIRQAIQEALQRGLFTREALIEYTARRGGSIERMIREALERELVR